MRTLIFESAQEKTAVLTGIRQARFIRHFGDISREGPLESWKLRMVIPEDSKGAVVDWLSNEFPQLLVEDLRDGMLDCIPHDVNQPIAMIPRFGWNRSRDNTLARQVLDSARMRMEAIVIKAPVRSGGERSIHRDS